MSATRTLFAVACLLSTTACDLNTALAPRVDLDVRVHPEPIDTFDTSEDITIELTELRTAVQAVEFTTEGELHARVLHDLLVPTAFAHPGHEAGGEVVGELAGRYVIDWLDADTVLGPATLLTTDFSGANFGFTRAQASDGLQADDPIIGHTFLIAGTARRGDDAVEFVAYVDQDDDRSIIGLPLDFTASEASTESLALCFEPVDRIEGDSIFDGIDVIALDEDGDGFVEIADDANVEAWAMLRRNLQLHDHYAVEVIQ